MQVAKWGNSLAVRLPKALVDKLSLKPGDKLEIVATEADKVEITKSITRENARAKALETLKSLQRPFPADYRFDRDEANSR